jgi:hypothetical protein|tara:strand:+ start:523 stop:1155 length:633 start_codon:yes stop_codon:yes gene_type:complete
MPVLSTLIFKVVNGRAKAATAQVKEMEQLASDLGARNQVAARVLTGEGVGGLQLRIFADDVVHAGEISAGMYGSEFYSRLSEDINPPAEMVNVIRSNVLHLAAPRIEPDEELSLMTVLGIQPHPGKADELESRLGEWADLWVEGGARTSFVTSSFSGTPGPAVFVTSVYKDWAAWSGALEHSRKSALWRTLRESSATSGTIMGNFQLGRV